MGAGGGPLPGGAGAEGGGAPYAPVGAGSGYSPGTEIPLVPRQQRRRQRLARGALLLILLVGGLGAAGYVAADRLLGDDYGDDAAVVPAVPVASPTAEGDAAESGASAPTATRRASVAGVVATPTPTPGAAEEPAPAAAEETAAPGGADDPPADETAEAEAAAEEPAGEPPALEALLPSVDEIPAGFVVSVDAAERPVEDVAVSLGSEDALETLEALGWEGNWQVTFAPETPEELAPGDTTAVNVSAHRFATPNGAAEGLDYYADQLVALLGFAEFRVDSIGDEVRALRGVNEGEVAQVALYVQFGSDLVRISGTSNTEEGDPTQDVTDVAEAVAAKVN